MIKYKLTISYDGAKYCGWQIQPNGLSIQEVLQKALTILCQENITVIGSSRTDSGVHALHQVVHFSTKKAISVDRLNGILPMEIRAHSLEIVPAEFHALFSAKQKLYHYYLITKPSPFLYPYSLYEPHLDLDLIKLGAKKFIGTKDFTSFANVCKFRKDTDKVRTIYEVDIREVDSVVIIAMLGNGFLYKMVRNIVGCLLALSRKKILLEDIDTIFSAKDRRKAPMSAKAKGLFLIDVIYETNSECKATKDSKCFAPIFFASSTPK